MTGRFALRGNHLLPAPKDRRIIFEAMQNVCVGKCREKALRINYPCMSGVDFDRYRKEDTNM